MKIPNKRILQQITLSHSSDIGFKDFMKLCKYYIKETFSFLIKDTTLSLNNLLRFRKNLKWLLVRKSKQLIKNRVKQSTIQFMGKDILLEKELLEKNCFNQKI